MCVQDVLGLAKLKILGDELNKRDRKKDRGQHTQVSASKGCLWGVYSRA